MMTIAEYLRYLVADTTVKLNDDELEADRQYLIEDLLARLEHGAREADLSVNVYVTLPTGDDLPAGARAYDLIPPADLEFEGN
jgi:hypothetical protein